MTRVPTTHSRIQIPHPQLPIRLLEHGLHLEIRRREPLARGTEPGDALLEQGERGVELDVVRLEPADDLLEPGEVLGDGRHQGSTRASTRPSATRR